jgi:processive 1,2-diacylglycerol beta-glucosyltransferase
VNVLVLSASAGAGHTRAGQALEEAVREVEPGATVRHVDVLDLTAGAYKKAYVESYLRMVDSAPALWGYLYAASDHERRSGARERVVRFFDKLEFARFRRFVRQAAPDVVLATHFLPLQVFGPNRRKGRDLFPMAVAVTDFDVHHFWVDGTCDRYFVASEEIAAVLEGRGIEPGRVAVSGIPIASAFREPHDAAEIRRRLGLGGVGGPPTVLLMSGGAGVGTVEDAARAILCCGPVRLLAVAGRNRALKEALERLAVPDGSSLVAFGFVERISELMAVADLAVTKSGGLTTAECLAMGLPMVLRDPIPGQEERNCDAVLEGGAGLKAHGIDSLRFKVQSLLADRARLGAMRDAARRAGRPRAAVQIVRETLALARERNRG